MKLFRPSRLATALITLFSIVFMQLAIAGYACPELASGQCKSFEGTSSVDYRTVPGCSGMDEMRPSLCHAYDHAGSQSLDKAGQPNVQPFVPAGLMLTLSFTDAVNRPIFIQPDPLLPRHAAAPPLSIRNCCFRI